MAGNDEQGGLVTGGIEAALEQARAAAGEKGVTVMGGAETGQQFLRAGLVDELSIHLVPVLFGSGTRMFDNLGGQHLQLEPAETIQTAAATHLRYAQAPHRLYRARALQHFVLGPDDRRILVQLP